MNRKITKERARRKRKIGRESKKGGGGEKNVWKEQDHTWSVHVFI